VYSSRRWSANDPVDLHHESSYTFEIPTLLMYACRVALTTGGATLLADAAAVLEALPTSIVDRFEREGWILTRNYHRGLGPSLEDTFSTNNPTDIENYCRANAINHEWATDGALRTQQRLPAVMCHPITGKRCWFNQIAFLNESSLDPEVHDYLLELYTREGLSFNTCYGNGEPIGAKVINLITTAYQHSTIAVPWLAGDLLLIDNIRTAHGRDPYHGPRELLVAMAEPLRSQPDP
jgi:alpha-ketoglutarate-dependent taurine dioxygenase